MKYLIVEPKVKAIAPNIALMKYCRWCEQKGHQYQYVRGMVEPEITPDAILMTCIRKLLMWLSWQNKGSKL